MRSRRAFSPEFKVQVVLELLSGATSLAEAARHHQVKPDILSRWKAEFLERAPALFQSPERHRQDQARVADLERLVGKLTLELEVTKKASSLLHGRRESGEGWR
jgi:transposase